MEQWRFGEDGGRWSSFAEQQSLCNLSKEWGEYEYYDMVVVVGGDYSVLDADGEGPIIDAPLTCATTPLIHPSTPFSKKAPTQYPPSYVTPPFLQGSNLKDLLSNHSSTGFNDLEDKVLLGDLGNDGDPTMETQSLRPTRVKR
ncbi:hypothetical protein Lal_00004111 [Lupinus albus]|nr:hypothetical protein Lal_00004111 [Lupinus albus]